MDMGLRPEENRKTRRRKNDEQSNKKRVATQQNQLTGNSRILKRRIN